MSSLGRKVSQIRKSGKNKAKLFFPEKFPIGIKTPLEPGYRDNESLFKMHFDPLEQIKDNLKNLILTQKGERIGFPDFGTDLLQIYSNTELSDDEISDRVMFEIKSAVNAYMPSIFLKNFYSQKISTDEKGINKAAVEFSNGLENISFGETNISKFNNNSITKETVYQLDIDYQISSFSNEIQKIILFIKSAR